MITFQPKGLYSLAFVATGEFFELRCHPVLDGVVAGIHARHVSNMWIGSMIQQKAYSIFLLHSYSLNQYSRSILKFRARVINISSTCNQLFGLFKQFCLKAPWDLAVGQKTFLEDDVL
jgi:hypothetical protein